MIVNIEGRGWIKRKKNRQFLGVIVKHRNSDPR